MSGAARCGPVALYEPLTVHKDRWLRLCQYLVEQRLKLGQGDDCGLDQRLAVVTVGALKTTLQALGTDKQTNKQPQTE